MVAAFIRERGVTVCPPCGSPELARVNVEREKAWAEANRKRWGFGYGAKKRRRGATA